MYTRDVNARERLIDSTRELLWERGYVGTSPKAIQERSGAGQGSMYHHFHGKRDLALAAIEQNAADLRREREALRGCPVGRLTQDPDVMADPDLRRPVEETFGWLRARLAGLLEEGRARGQLAPSLDPQTVATALVAVLQGGYVLARASGSADTYRQAVDGALDLLACHTGEE
jgi:TetR/AcrR family transcriptional regulator, transcriptional repressor for nem operon